MPALYVPEINLRVVKLIDQYHLTTCVETGTCVGSSTHHAAQLFRRVVTMEIRQDYIDRAKAACTGMPNIEFLHGDSGDLMPGVLATLDRPALFWLDAHNADRIYADGPDSCALPDELFALLPSPIRHVILIDDANCFTLPQPRASKTYPEYPWIKQMAEAAGYSVDIEHDVIWLLPK
jgi:hypothetical protein